MLRSSHQGIFFCAKAGERTYLRFIHTDDDWKPIEIADESGSSAPVKPAIDGEIGRCLRLIECTQEEAAHTSPAAQEAAYDLWNIVQRNIYEHWMHETDPANLQPSIRPLNRKVTDFIHAHATQDEKQRTEALNILAEPWSKRDELELRSWFETQLPPAELCRFLIDKIRNSGFEELCEPKPLPLIRREEIKLLAWMAIAKKSTGNS